MKKIISSALAMSALIVCSAQAADLPSKKPPTAPAPEPANATDAYVSIAAGQDWSRLTAPGFNADSSYPAFAARGTFASPIMGALGFQVDGVYERSAYDLGSLSTKKDLIRNSGDLAAHLYLRNNTGLIGVIGQVGSSDLNVGSQTDQRAYAGVEAQYFLGNATLYGQATYQKAHFGVFALGSTSDFPLEGQGINLMGQLRYFVTPNAMLALKGGYESLRTDVINSHHLKLNAWSVGLRGEYRFDQMPISAFADLDYRKGELNVGSRKETETRAMLGLKYSFGSKTLLDRDRNGASLDPVRSLKAIFPVIDMPH